MADLFTCGFIWRRKVIYIYIESLLDKTCKIKIGATEGEKVPCLQHDDSTVCSKQTMKEVWINLQGYLQVVHSHAKILNLEWLAIPYLVGDGKLVSMEMLLSKFFTIEPTMVLFLFLREFIMKRKWTLDLPSSFCKP